MCGRFTRRQDPRTYAALLGVDADTMPAVPASYNVAPSQAVLAARVEDGERKAVLLHWGLVPSWSKDGRPFINARAEGIEAKP
jgi:putative SOS response-associated peptidase YedK